MSPHSPRVFGGELLDALTAQAGASARRRKNFNFHRADSDPAHRLLNAMEPDSYVQPHRHLEAFKDETFVVVRGAFGLVIFDETGRVQKTALLRAGGDFIGADIRRGIFHCLVSLESGSVFLEAKAGPYNVDTDKQAAPWAPAEGDAAAAQYHAQLKALFRERLE